MASRRRTRRTPAGLPPALRALADPTRLRILLLLEGRPRAVGEIVDFFALSQPTISRHLQTLTAAGLVERRRQAQHVIYQTHGVRLGTLCVFLADAFPSCGVVVRKPGRAGRAKEPGKYGAVKTARKPVVKTGRG